MVLFAVYGFDYKLFSDNLKELCEKIRYIYFACCLQMSYPFSFSVLKERSGPVPPHLKPEPLRRICLPPTASSSLRTLATVAPVDTGAT